MLFPKQLVALGALAAIKSGFTPDGLDGEPETQFLTGGDFCRKWAKMSLQLFENEPSWASLRKMVEKFNRASFD